MGRKGRKEWQEKNFRQNHERLKKIIHKKEGVTKSELCKQTGLSVPTINKHLTVLINKERTVVFDRSWPRRYFWLPHIELVRYRKMIEYLKLKEELNKQLAQRIAQAEATLPRDDPLKWEILEDTISILKNLLQRMSDSGIKEAANKLDSFNKYVKEWREFEARLDSAPPDKQFNILMKEKSRMYG